MDFSHKQELHYSPLLLELCQIKMKITFSVFSKNVYCIYAPTPTESLSCLPTAAALLPRAPRCNYLTYTKKESVLVYLIFLKTIY